LTRNSLIKSLFNAERTDWNITDIIQFIKQVDNKTAPQYLDFNGDKWYANVNCAILWNGKPKTAMLKLRIQKLPNGSSKWVIFDADAKFFNVNNVANVEQPTIPKPTDNSLFLNPDSHALNFFNIDVISRSPKNIANFLMPSSDYSIDCSLFINECLGNHVKIISVKSVTYSFFQIKGWDMEIQQFNRQSKNSGWLINKLIKLPF